MLVLCRHRVVQRFRTRSSPHPKDPGRPVVGPYSEAVSSVSWRHRGPKQGGRHGRSTRKNLGQRITLRPELPEALSGRRQYHNTDHEPPAASAEAGELKSGKDAVCTTGNVLPVARDGSTSAHALRYHKCVGFFCADPRRQAGERGWRISNMSEQPRRGQPIDQAGPRLTVICRRCRFTARLQYVELPKSCPHCKPQFKGDRRPLLELHGGP